MNIIKKSEIPRVTDAMLRIAPNESETDEDFKGITDSLAIIENLADVDPGCIKNFAKVE